MVCPQCGYDMGNANKCMRCGYIVKTIAVVDKADDEKTEGGDETPETIVIDPSETYLSGYDYDDGMFGGGVFGDPFSALFGDIFDPIGDILGGLFGIDIRPERSQSRNRHHATEEDMREHKKRKREAAPVVEVHDVEIVDEHGKPIEQKPEEPTSANKEKPAHKHKDAPKTAHPHYRRKDKNQP